MRNDLRRILMMVLLLGLLSMAHGGAGGGAQQYDPPVSNPGCTASQGDCSGE